MQKSLHRMLLCCQSVLVSSGPVWCRHIRSPASSCTVFHGTGAAALPYNSKQSLRPILPRSQATAVDTSAIAADSQTAGRAPFSLDSRMTWPSRTHEAGTLTASDAGKDITVCGWVDRNRNLGGLGFMDVRDHTGLLQVCDRWQQREHKLT